MCPSVRKMARSEGSRKGGRDTKTVVLGITGGIAAYKTIELAGTLTKQGIRVQAVLTGEARKFITPLTMEVITGQPVWTDENCLELSAIPHIELAEMADLILVAPASANTIAKCAAGIADNLLTSTILAATSPVLYVPAMNNRMYEHPSTRKNLETLAENGFQIMTPDSGPLACGTTGKGRYPENSRILAEIENILFGDRALKGLQVLITAGGTREPIDPVRYIGNRSSGKMGAALAEEAAARGARVTLVLGSHQLTELPDVEIVSVETAEDMYEAVMERLDRQDIVIKAAAVADFRPVEASPRKIKKEGASLQLSLERTRDILMEVARRRKDQIVIGFAAETGDPEAYALAKLKEKELDMLVANDVSRDDSGFGTDTNLAALYFADGAVRSLPLMTKEKLAGEILSEIIKLPKFGKIAK